MALVSLGTSTVAKNFNPNFLIISRQSPTISKPFVVNNPVSYFDIASASYSITKSLTLNDQNYTRKNFKVFPVKATDLESFSPPAEQQILSNTYTEFLVQAGLPFWS
jgi:hypothetical protein